MSTRASPLLAPDPIGNLPGGGKPLGRGWQKEQPPTLESGPLGGQAALFLLPQCWVTRACQGLWEACGLDLVCWLPPSPWLWLWP